MTMFIIGVSLQAVIVIIALVIEHKRKHDPQYQQELMEIIKRA